MMSWVMKIENAESSSVCKSLDLQFRNESDNCIFNYDLLNFILVKQYYNVLPLCNYVNRGINNEKKNQKKIRKKIRKKNRKKRKKEKKIETKLEKNLEKKYRDELYIYLSFHFADPVPPLIGHSGPFWWLR